MRKTLLAVLAIFAVGAPAAAQPPSPPTAAVRYGDLDLRDPAAAKAMLSRIRKAAVEACSTATGAGGSADDIARFGACHRQAVADAVARLAAPGVTTAYGNKAAQKMVAGNW
jgi:UrcA family protein